MIICPYICILVLHNSFVLIFVVCCQDDAISRQYPVVDHDYDAVVVGAGGAGSSSKKTRMISCRFITASTKNAKASNFLYSQSYCYPL